MVEKLDKEPEDKKNSHGKDDNEIIDKLDQTAERVMAYSKSNKVNTAAFILLVIGFFISLINPSIGASLVGIIIGAYFNQELLEFFTNLNSRISEHGMFRYLVLGIASLTLIIAQPYFFIGLGITLGIKAVMR